VDDASLRTARDARGCGTIALVKRTIAALAFLALVMTSVRADATCFCMMRMPPRSTRAAGSSITDDPSYNPASAVFILRDGTRTIMTIEAAYEGPAVELTLVVPVPTPIEREDVRTVSGSLFRRLDRATAPKVEHVYTACRPLRRALPMRAMGEGTGAGHSEPEPEQGPGDYGISIEDEWEVEEYDITLLSAQQSTGLLRYLRDQGLALPDRADEVLRGYMETGHRFIVAKADPSRAERIGERMMLSPLQIAYDSEELRIPVRLGTLNSPGEQELLLYVLSREGRFELANRPNVTAPSDVRLRNEAAGRFAPMYAALLDEVFHQTPNAAVTEYARTIGKHVHMRHVWRFGFDELTQRPGGRGEGRWTITRMRHRYGTDLSDDLVLRPAEPLRLTRRWRHWQLRDATSSRYSAFHVRFVVEHGGSRCPSDAEQARNASRWATSEAMWESSEDAWPGSFILDPIESPRIEPGSSPPVREEAPPPPEPEPVAPPEPRAAEPAPPARPVAEPSGCSASRGGSSSMWLVIAMIVVIRVRRRSRS
jgi:hypothetical protein